MNVKKLIVAAIVVGGELLLIAYLIPGYIAWISLGIGIAAASYFLYAARKVHNSETREPSRHITMFALLSMLIIPVIIGWLTLNLGYLSILTALLATALTVEFFSNFLALPLSVYHKYLELNIKETPIYRWPSITIVVPAHNEEKVIERCIEAILEIDYPKKEVIVVDDGSKDKTYRLATNYRPKGVMVLRRDKAGGKSAALNTGILVAKGEIIITCDADSLIGRGALRRIARRFQDSSVSAVAGNVKVLNRTNLVTNCQALEYVVNENIYRRVFDIFGVVPVVPGPLASFRKRSLKEIGFYDRDTLTEDFDITIKLLKTQKIVQALSDANVYTEAPSSWKDFIKQRTRWNRGTFQTVIKHRNVFGNPRFGYLRNLTFQYIILSMIFVPLVSVVSLIVIVIAVLMGYGLQVLVVMAMFMLIQATYSFLAIMMDNEDFKLVVFSPLFVVGYKELRNFIKIKSLFDILSRREMKWGTLTRVGTPETKSTVKSTSSIGR
ncbi:MAG TPA: glycosyltransferase family 2 protein [Candidatus Bathyarchaeota archaeon]|nr:glycosyltransferase family 2 protein [Candidatus Bathyarchaeota archaeon]